MANILTITPESLYQLMKIQNILLLDVREEEEYAAGYIEGASLHPLSRFDPISVLPFGETIVAYCHLGKRSEVVCKYLLSLDSSLKLFNLEGGIAAWQKKNFSVIVPD